MHLLSRRSDPLTHGAFGSDGHRLQQDLHDAGSDPRRRLFVSVQVVQHLLDDVVGVLRLEEPHKHKRKRLIWREQPGRWPIR